MMMMMMMMMTMMMVMMTTSSTASPGEERCELQVLIRNGGYYGYVRRRTEFEDDETVAVEDYKLMDEE